jgi:acetyltransferase-like isoleucine patch superfamily enzyme
MQSIISPKAKIGNNVTIGDFVKIHDNVVIEDNTIIGDYCHIGIESKNANGRNLIIGPNSNVRSHCVIYQGATFEERLETGHHALIRENVHAGKNLRVGSYSELEGNIKIGHFTRIHSKVAISPGCEIGDLVYLFPRVQTSNDPLPPSHIGEPVKIGHLAVVSINSLLMPGVEIGLGSFVSGGSTVKNDVAPGMCVAGSPAKQICKVTKMINLKHKIIHPWPNHFKDNYPPDSHELIDMYVSQLKELIA